jgi:uncharacterized protein (DUF983 family)
MMGGCPACGVGPLFGGILKLAPKCTACGLDYSRFDQGDGPAAFAVFGVGAVVLGAALWVEFAFHPPVWLHVVLWVPITFGLTILSLRMIKSWLVHQQYSHLPPPETPPVPPLPPVR